MLLGPIFQAELLRTARRRRYYVVRTFYGMLLLFIIWAGYEGATRGKTVVTIDEAAEYAMTMFATFAVVQIITVLLLIPALFGGAIADEKQRKTLHYLMASRLSSFEIVVDKVLGRAPHLMVLLALGLPVICLLGLVGGVPPEYVAVAYVGTISTATMALAMTVLVSTLSRRVRQAVLISYIFLVAWQLAPSFLLGVGKSGLFPQTYPWIEPIVHWVGLTTPLYAFADAAMRMRGSRLITSLAVEQFAWMVGLQLGMAALMIALAVWRLRPAFRRHEATQPRRKWFEWKDKASRASRPPRWLARPDCGDDAMGWKERHFARSDVFTKMVVLPSTVLVSVLLVLCVGIDESLLRTVSDLWTGRLRGWGQDDTLVGHLRLITAWYTAIWLLALAGGSASSVAVEREEDTWVSLTSTPLTGWEILRGKVLGALWAQRGFALIPLGFWGIGLLIGAVHPLGVLGAVVALGVVSWMVAAVGIHASLRATSTSRALTSTILTLAILYGYPVFLFDGLLSSGLWDPGYAMLVGLPSRLAVAPLVSYHQSSSAWGQASTSGLMSVTDAPKIVSGLILMAFYASIAAALTFRTVTQFDRWLDRPTITHRPEPHRKPAPSPQEAEAVLQS